MSNTKHTDVLTGEGLEIGSLGNRFITFGLAAAVLGLGASAVLAQRTEPKVAAHSYLLAVVYFISIALGALFFVQLQHLARAGWSTVVRRLAEMISTSLPVLLLFLLPLLVGVLGGSDALLPWANADIVKHDHVLQEKEAYLNVPFLLVRVGLYFVLWTFFSRFFFNRSVKQDTTGDLKLSYTMQWVAAPAMACFVLSATFFSFDFLMSLDPKFISTLFGIYYFAGCAISFFATTTILTRFLQSTGRLKDIVSQEHYHDLGKFMFGFTFFWGYAAFSQYMLIWYANIPEETEWYMQRQEGSWIYLSLFLLFGHFIFPFAGLLSRHVKRNLVAVTFFAVWLLGMEWVDLYWLIMPSTGAEGPPLCLLDLTCWIGMAGVFVAHFGFVARGKRLLAVQDPRIAESLAFENA